MNSYNKEVEKEKVELPKSKNEKCDYCNKGLILLETLTNKCKCKKFYCKKHLFYKNHNCNFNYIREFKEISTSNIIVLENNFANISILLTSVLSIKPCQKALTYI